MTVDSHHSRQVFFFVFLNYARKFSLILIQNWSQCSILSLVWTTSQAVRETLAHESCPSLCWCRGERDGSYLGVFTSMNSMTQAEFSSLFKKSLKSLQVTRRTALNMLLGQSHHVKEYLFFGHSQVAQHIRGVGGKLGVLCDHELWGQIVTMWDSTDVSLRCDKATPTVGHKTIQRHSPHQPWWPQLCCVWPQTLRFLQGKFHD